MSEGYEALSPSEMEIFQLAARDMEEQAFEVSCLSHPDSQALCCMYGLSDEQHTAVTRALVFVQHNKDKDFRNVLLYTFRNEHHADTLGYEAGTFYVFATNLPTKSGNEVMVPFTENVRQGLDPAIINHASEQLKPWSLKNFINSADPAATLVAQSALFVVAFLIIWAFKYDDPLIVLLCIIPTLFAWVYYHRMITRERAQYEKDYARTAEMIRRLRTEEGTTEPRMHLVGV